MKKALFALAVLLLLGGVGVYLAFNYIDLIVKVALEHYGPQVLGVPVKVGAVKISPRDGRGEVRDLELGSPPGFSAPRTARFGEVRLALDPATITADVVVIRELTVDALQINYERGDKSTNLDAIQRQIDAYIARAQGEQAAQGGPGSRAKKRRFIVERLALRNGRVTMTTPALRGQGIGFDLPLVVLRDLGRNEGGLTASEIASRVANALQVRIAQKVLGNVELLRKGGVEGAIDALKGLLR
jgi:uncharacterized protein involved in outer membrane biogenesis